MVLKDVKYDTISQATVAPTGGAIQGGVDTATTAQDFGTWNLEFSTQGSYSNFLNFIKDLENNLRIVDISSIQFSSDTALTPAAASSSSSSSSLSSPSDSYKYGFKIKTYWLKN